MLRYVERNALRAKLVRRAESWAWSSVRWWRERRQWQAFLHEGPVSRGPRWVETVNRPMTAAEEEALRRSVNRGTPWGAAGWQKRIARRLGLESTLRPRGRPKKAAAVRGQKRKSRRPPSSGLGERALALAADSQTGDIAIVGMGEYWIEEEAVRGKKNGRDTRTTLTEEARGFPVWRMQRNHPIGN